MTQIKVHRVLEGPFSSEDCPEYDDYEPFFWIEALVEYGDGVLSEMQIMHEDFNHLYKIVQHMGKPTVEPYTLGVDYVA